MADLIAFLAGIVVIVSFLRLCYAGVKWLKKRYDIKLTDDGLTISKRPNT